MAARTQTPMDESLEKNKSELCGCGKGFNNNNNDNNDNNNSNNSNNRIDKLGLRKSWVGIRSRYV